MKLSTSNKQQAKKSHKKQKLTLQTRQIHTKHSAIRTKSIHPPFIPKLKNKQLQQQQQQQQHLFSTSRSTTSEKNEQMISAQFIEQVPSQPSEPGNTNPGYITSPQHPNTQYVASPRDRKYVYEIDETPVKIDNRAQITQEHIVPGYRYILRHVKHIFPIDRKMQFQTSLRSDFEILRRSKDIHQAQVVFDRLVPNIWSQLSVLRMNMSKFTRPKIPTILQQVTEYLGAQEGAGWFCAVPNNDDRFNQQLKNTNIIHTKSQSFQQKAKIYNLDLHPSDIAKHHELNERFHFNGKERSHRY